MLGIFLFLYSLTLLSHTSTEASSEASYTLATYTCLNSTEISPTSSYKPNLDTLFSSLRFYNNTNPSFRNATVTQSPSDRVFGSFLCTGYVDAKDCQECFEAASKNIIEKCPGRKQSIIWYDRCMLRYSDKSFFSIMELEPVKNLTNNENVLHRQDQFMELLLKTMRKLKDKVVGKYGKLRKKYHTKKATLSIFQPVYNFVECSPDISAADCSKCLETAISHLNGCCWGKIGGRILLPSCSVRYEMYPFYGSSSKGTLLTVMAILVATAVVGLALFPAVYWLYRKTKAKKAMNETRVPTENSTGYSQQYSLAAIKAATNNFSDDNKLGEGGYGPVYKGTLPNGQDIAAKRLSRSSGQGAEEFKNEVDSITNLQHRNLVRLLGICFQGDEKILVYEFCPNRSLDYLLFDASKKGQLDWPRRYSIIIGIARGLLYLHEDSRLRIVHRDLKASNVLLDKYMNPRISDFGTARIIGVDQTEGRTNRIVGTHGYMSPEYVYYGNFSAKSDVFSFGVLTLEILSSKKNRSYYGSEGGKGLLDLAWNHWKNGTPMELIDPALRASCLIDEVTRCIHVALLCVEEDIEVRPTMASVVAMLNSDTISPPLPKQPAFVSSSVSQLDPPRSPGLQPPTCYVTEPAIPTCPKSMQLSRITIF